MRSKSIIVLYENSLYARKRVDPIIINIYPYKVLMYDSMIEFSKIMVGIDGSEESINAADYAIAIANMYNAELS